jgi:hypothetical protein
MKMKPQTKGGNAGVVGTPTPTRGVGGKIMPTTPAGTQNPNYDIADHLGITTTGSPTNPYGPNYDPTAVGSFGTGTSGTINFPQMGQMSDWTDQMAGILPDQDYSYTDITPMEYMDQSYYDTMTKQAEDELNKQYFSTDDSLSNRLKQQMAARGLAGSGIEAGSTTELYGKYGSDLSNALAEISKTKAEKDLEVSQANKEIEQQNRQNRLDYMSGRLDQGKALLSGGLDYGKLATDTGIQGFKTQADLQKTKSETLNQFLDSMASMSVDPNISAQDRSSMIEAFMRQYYGGYDPTMA